MYFCPIINGITDFFRSVTPNPSFLSDVAAFEAAIIALLIPLSIEIVSKISERYNSDAITRAFENGWGNKILPPFLLINIVAAVFLRFVVSDQVSNDSIIWKICAWIVLLIFIIIAVAIWRVIMRIKMFVGDPKAVIDQLYKDVEVSLE
ncbi:MAG: hypothetical protein ABIE74_07770 [Pseudomonadota bacterium]